MKGIVRRTVQIWVALGYAAGVFMGRQAMADGIQFSKPDVEIAKPVLINPNLPPEAREKERIEFSKGASGPSVAPMAPRTEPPPPMPRRERKPNLLEQSGLFRDKDANKQDDDEEDSEELRPERKESLKESLLRAARPAPGTDFRRRTDNQEALSPIQEFDWEPKEKEDEEFSGLSTPRLEAPQLRQSDSGLRWSLPLLRDDATQPAGQSFLFSVNPGDEETGANPGFTPAQLERRAEFDRLLKSVPDDPRTAGSLDLIASPFESPKPPAADLLNPGPAFQKVSPFNPVAQPLTVGPAADSRFGPGLGELVKAPAAKAPAAPALGDPTRLQQPLMKQPTRLDFPGRNF